jgi:hypothetical protein
MTPHLSVLLTKITEMFLQKTYENTEMFLQKIYENTQMFQFRLVIRLIFVWLFGIMCL